jgi:flagellar motor switch protein FliG
MDKIQALRLGAHVMERLSLAAQADFALRVLAGSPLGDDLLADLGRIDRGPEFLGLYGTTLELKELIGVLNHVDRFTEARLVEHLEAVAPAEAEILKQNFFVFEDVFLFDGLALRRLVETADRDLLAQAMAGTERRVVNHILSALDPDDGAELAARVAGADTDRRLVRSAQELVVHGIKDLEQSGQLVIRRQGDRPDGEIFLTVPT